MLMTASISSAPSDKITNAFVIFKDCSEKLFKICKFAENPKSLDTSMNSLNFWINATENHEQYSKVIYLL